MRNSIQLGVIDDMKNNIEKAQIDTEKKELTNRKVKEAVEEKQSSVLQETAKQELQSSDKDTSIKPDKPAKTQYGGASSSNVIGSAVSAIGNTLMGGLGFMTSSGSAGSPQASPWLYPPQNSTLPTHEEDVDTFYSQQERQSSEEATESLKKVERRHLW